MSGWEWLIGAGAAFLGSLGLGGGSLLLLWLTLLEGMPQLAAQGVNLAFFLAASGVSVAVYVCQKLVVWRAFLLAAAAGIPGVLLGWWLSGLIDANELRRVFALLLITIGLYELFGRTKKREKSNRVKNKCETDSKSQKGMI